MQDTQLQAQQYVQNVRSFYGQFIHYLAVMSGLLVLNLWLSPGYLWMVWPAAGWGISLGLQAITTFGQVRWFGPEWEQRQLQKYHAKYRAR